MPERSSRPKRPIDLNQLAASIVQDATDNEPETTASETPAKNEHAVALGRRGGVTGGPARAKKLTPEQRREIAKKAAAIRWNPRNKPN